MCQTVREDDPSISNDDQLLRRVHLTQIVRDEDTGRARISSGAFSSREKELSVNILSVLRNSGEEASACLRHSGMHKLVSFTAGSARALDQIVCRDPVPPDNISHGLVCGSKGRRVIEGLRRAATWVVPSEAPDYEEIAREKKMRGLPE